VLRGAAARTRDGVTAAVSVADLLSARWDAVGEAGLAEVWLPAGFEVTYAGPGGREVRAGLDRLRRDLAEVVGPANRRPGQAVISSTGRRQT
jgi:hypothetical protein